MRSGKREEKKERMTKTRNPLEFAGFLVGLCSDTFSLSMMTSGFLSYFFSFFEANNWLAKKMKYLSLLRFFLFRTNTPADSK